jgi:peptidoglycan hydrolase-like protein with peptidoglycan-binding domain
VKALQTLLIGYGYSCGKAGADGDFGNSTYKALKNFQKDKGLSIDGYCGAKTWSKLLGIK